MNDPQKYVIYSTIGPPMTNDVDPIYQVSYKFPPVEVHVISSDEPPEQNRETTEVNVERITKHFAAAAIPVTSQYLNLEQFDENVFNLAAQLILSYQKNPKNQLVIDVSAGRGSIRHALSRGAEVAIDVIQKMYNPNYYIQAAIRSRNQPILQFKIGQTSIPEPKDIELLLIIDENMTQTALARSLGWNNQSEVSKAVHRLETSGLVRNIGHKTRELTEEGERIRDLFLLLVKNS